MLQAESEKLRQAWIQAVQASIASAYRESPDTYYIEVSHKPSGTNKLTRWEKCLFVLKFIMLICSNPTI